LSSDRIREADESVAKRFSRIMCAATSPRGLLTDPPIVGVTAAILLTVAIALYQTVLEPEQVYVIYAAVALPVGLAALVWLSLLGARKQVVTWLAGLPFPVENVNALLNGVGQNLLIRFAAEPPERDDLNSLLEQVHVDYFALEYAEEEPEIEVRIGVLDSKWNPAAANYRRFARTKRLVEDCLVPLAKDHPIEKVRVT